MHILRSIYTSFALGGRSPAHLSRRAEADRVAESADEGAQRHLRGGKADADARGPKAFPHTAHLEVHVPETNKQKNTAKPRPAGRKKKGTSTYVLVSFRSRRKCNSLHHVQLNRIHAPRPCACIKFVRDRHPRLVILRATFAIFKNS